MGWETLYFLMTKWEGIPHPKRFELNSHPYNRALLYGLDVERNSEAFHTLFYLQLGLLRWRRDGHVEQARQQLLEASLAHVRDDHGTLWPGAE